MDMQSTKEHINGTSKYTYISGIERHKHDKKLYVQFTFVIGSHFFLALVI